MLLGKRPRPPMKRTTSMSEITLDLNAAASDATDQRRSGAGGGALTPKILRRHSSDFVDTPHFLRACALCKGRLAPGRDIYMYRFNSVAFPTVAVNSIVYLFISQFWISSDYFYMHNSIFFFLFVGVTVLSAAWSVVSIRWTRTRGKRSLWRRRRSKSCLLHRLVLKSPPPPRAKPPWWRCRCEIQTQHVKNVFL